MCRCTVVPLVPNMWPPAPKYLWVGALGRVVVRNMRSVLWGCMCLVLLYVCLVLLYVCLHPPLYSCDMWESPPVFTLAEAVYLRVEDGALTHLSELSPLYTCGQSPFARAPCAEYGVCSRYTAVRATIFSRTKNHIQPHILLIYAFLSMESGRSGIWSL